MMADISRSMNSEESSEYPEQQSISTYLCNMNVIGSLRRQLSTPVDVKGATEERHEVKAVENQRFNPSTLTWSFKNLTKSDPKR